MKKPVRVTVTGAAGEARIENEARRVPRARSIRIEANHIRELQRGPNEFLHEEVACDAGKNRAAAVRRQ